MKRQRLVRIAALLIIGLGIASRRTEAASKLLAVPNVNQLPQTNWCWAATSQAVLSFTGNAPGMCVIADWARDKNGWGSDNCCTNGTGAICNQPNAMWGSAGSIRDILANWGAESETKSTSLSLKTVQEALDGDSPIFVRWGWTTGGGHFVVLHGYSDSTMTVMDPWNGPTTMSHSALRSTPQRTWTHTLIVKPKRVTYVVDDTGSMADEISSVRATLIDQVDDFEMAGKFVQYTLVTYKDSVQVRGRTTVHADIRSWVNTLSASGGGDCPEEGYGALDEACQQSPKSDIWWMTDADSHGGFLRMLQSQFRLWIGGCKLHSTILGSCTSFPVVTTAPNGPDAGQLQSTSYNETIAGKPATVSFLPDVGAFTAGESLSSLTGGLFFPVTTATLAGATEIILQEVLSSALITRLKLPAGNQVTMVPVDASLADLKIILDVSLGATGVLAVTDPLGTTLNPGDPGISEIVSGQSRLLILTPPALKRGVYKIQSESDVAYLLSVSGAAPHGVSLAGDFTAGIGEPFALQLLLSAAEGPTGIAGPGDTGPGGPLDPVGLARVDTPYELDRLHFFRTREDGSDVVSLDLFDDGLHADGDAGDGLYGGTTTFATQGRYRLYAADEVGLFLRAAAQVVAANAVSVGATDPVVTAPDSMTSHTFTVRNLSGAARTFDVAASSNNGWEDLTGVPSALLLQAGEETQITVPVQVPLGALSGDASAVSLSAAAQDDPLVNDTAQTATVAWTGPLLQSLGAMSVHPGDELVLRGNLFGSDPGAGNRSTTSHHITLGGVQVPDENVLEWSPTIIRVRVPPGTRSGVVFVVVLGSESNEVPIVVLQAQFHPTSAAPAVSTMVLLVLCVALMLLGGWRISTKERQA